CPICGSNHHRELFAASEVPLVACNFPRSRAAALAAPMGDIELVYCRNCGHAFNRAFEPDRAVYDRSYENALDSSPRYRAHRDRTIDSLVNGFGIQGKTVVEIGSGSGHFL